MLSVIRNMEVETSMQCPRTNTPLKKVNVGKVPVYVSEACGGVFLENQTLKLFKCPDDKRGHTLANHLKQFHGELLELVERVSCPTCADTVMLRRFYSPLHVVEIDECPGCGGIWLDTGELSKLQSLMLNEKERALLRHQLMEENRRIEIKGLPHKHDYWKRRSDKIDKLFELTAYITDVW
jgi:Zn-finger nucleic acid-binding protein